MDDDDADSRLEELTDRIDAHVRAVAELLPFPAELEADMGGAFVLTITLGIRGSLSNDPADVAGIDPEDSELRWWFHTDGGIKNTASPHTLDTDPVLVARWLTQIARLEGSPAALPQEG
jgi:hypothetical protein